MTQKKTLRNALFFLWKTCHNEGMQNSHHLRDAYRFPGLEPSASVHGYPGDPKAIILALRRRRKKQSVAAVDIPILRSTINVRA